MAVTTSGIVTMDDLIHACVRKPFGARAVCGVGRIVHEINAAFDPDRSTACPQCAERVNRPRPRGSTRNE
jgi:hypothetical protein